MTAPLAIQLYTVREIIGNDYAGVVRKIADIGYAGVEPAGFPGTTLAEAAKLFADLGLQVPSMHSAPPIGANRQSVLDTAATLGTTRLISGFGPDTFQDPAKLEAACATLNEGAAVAAEHGLTVGYHNHWWEYRALPGTDKLGIDRLLELLDPSVFFEVDTYWVKTGGQDPAATLRRLGDRAPVLHIKDGPADDSTANMVAVGRGVLDFHEIKAASETTAAWWIVELDRCATDMMQAVAESHRYLTAEGLAAGR